MTKLKVERGFALWMFGPPAAGKTTISSAVAKFLETYDVPVVLFDGDITRKIVGEGIGHTEEDRILLTRRYAALTSYLTQSKVIVILAAINHTNAQREFARAEHPDDQFGLVWIRTESNVCKERDPKGLYAKAQKMINEGTPANVVGVDIDFEEPNDFQMVIDTSVTSPEDAGPAVADFLLSVGALSKSSEDTSSI
ncbi:adenylyl-sulfate kinase [Rhodospirillales bacterium]|nr:adenylyl-sulfate kinase [Rhodospirillales bacterium]